MGASSPTSASRYRPRESNAPDGHSSDAPQVVVATALVAARADESAATRPACATRSRPTKPPVASFVDGPKGGGSKLDDAPTAQEAARSSTPRPAIVEAFAVLALSLGLRRGELLGLQWPDDDLETRSLTVNRTLQYMPGQGLVVSAPKTTASARTIPLPDRCATALREHRAGHAAERLAAGPAWQDSGHVFTTNQGSPIDPRNVLRWWHALTEKSGVGRRRLHAARHTAATVMLERGAPLEIVSAVLGHASLAITADVYARPAADAKRRALESVSESFATIAIV